MIKIYFLYFLNSLKDILFNTFPLKSTVWALSNTVNYIYYLDHVKKFYFSIFFKKILMSLKYNVIMITYDP